MESDVIIDVPKIMQRFLDNRDNRRSYSNPVYLSDKKDWQLGGDFEGDEIVFKRRTDYRDKTGKYIYEWDYVLIGGKKVLIHINGGLLVGRSDYGEISISAHTDKEFEIVGEFDFKGRIVIKGINAVSNNIKDMSSVANHILDREQNIKDGCKEKMRREY